MDNASGHTINLANSIIGVSILAMPYCFRQCGILLSICLLLISSIISRLACHFLLKSAIIARRKTFEFLAFHIFGSLGKFSIEIGMIGFLLGTCVAFFVVMGDLGPAILSEITGVRIGNTLRNGTLTALAVFCVLPLGLLRNVDSLNGVSTATIGFYCCLVLKIVIEALPHIFTGDWVSEVILWRPAGILQCLPIFSMALFCQTQLFEIYQAIPNASLEKMNSMIRVAVNMCTWVYIFVGAFGYIAFFQKPFTGNILLSFTESITSDVIKLGFVLSLAFSFPLVIFPCRASLYSLLYKGPSYTNIHEGGASNYIPEGKFKMLTLIIVFVSLMIGIMIPSIELVLGLIGSTIGVMICVLFPVTCFICISPKNTNERILAQIMLFVGVIVMVLGTYANLQAVEEAQNLQPVTEKILPPPQSLLKVEVAEPAKPYAMDIPTTIKLVPPEVKNEKPPGEKPNLAPPAEKPKSEENPKEVRHEPPQPEEPVEQPKPINLEKTEKKVNKTEKQGPVVEPVQPPDDKMDDHKKVEIQKLIKEAIAEQKPVDKPKKEVKKSEEVDVEAIKKEENELKEQEEVKEKDRNQILIDTIKKQNEVQQEIVEQQKKLIEVIQKQQEKQDTDKVNEEKVKAVKKIEDIAKRAIESISGHDKNVAGAVTEGEKNKGGESKNLGGNERVEPEVHKDVDDKTKLVVEEKVKRNQSKNDQDKVNLLPLPIVLAKLSNASLEAKAEAELKNKSGKVEESDVKALRRDILAESDEGKSRAKREVSESKMENLNKAVKEVCDELSKSTSTEKPIIKMLCKLSEPDLEAVGLGVLTDQKAVDLQPLKRDSKQFPV